MGPILLINLPIHLVHCEMNGNREANEDLKNHIILNGAYDIKLEFRNKQLWVLREKENFIVAQNAGFTRLNAVVEKYDDESEMYSFIDSNNLKLKYLTEKLNEIYTSAYEWRWLTISFHSILKDDHRKFIEIAIQDLATGIDIKQKEFQNINQKVRATCYFNDDTQVAFNILNPTGEDQIYSRLLYQFWYKIGDFKRIKTINGKKVEDYFFDYYDKNQPRYE